MSRDDELLPHFNATADIDVDSPIVDIKVESEIVIDSTDNNDNNVMLCEYECESDNNVNFSADIVVKEEIEEHIKHVEMDIESGVKDVVTAFESSGVSSGSERYVSSETASIKSDTSSGSSGCESGSNGGTADVKCVVKESVEYFCKWTHCDWPGNYDDLVDHIREIHVQLQPYHQQKHNWIAFRNGVTNGVTNGHNGLNAKRRHSDMSCSDDSNISNALSNDDSNDFNLSNKCGNSGHNEENESNATQQYVCLWEGCKVYGKRSLSRNWLERHVLQHSGPRPLKCIVEGCGARFKVQSALERHVNSHFKPNIEITCSNNSTNNSFEPSTSVSSLMPSNYADCSNHSFNNGWTNGLTPFEIHLQQSSHAAMMRAKSVDNNQAITNGSNGTHCPTNGTPNKILKRKKSATKLKRKYIIVKCSEDYFDECVMEKVRYGLIQLNAQTGVDISTESAITFRSKVIARRKSQNGEIGVLLKWEPKDILPDVWVTEPEVSSLSSKTVPISLLPHEYLAQVMQMNEECKPKMKRSRK